MSIKRIAKGLKKTPGKLKRFLPRKTKPTGLMKIGKANVKKTKAVQRAKRQSAKRKASVAKTQSVIAGVKAGVRRGVAKGAKRVQRKRKKPTGKLGVSVKGGILRLKRK